MNTPQPSTALVPVSTNSATAAALRQAVAAHLARYTGQTRTHTESDLRAYLTWCTDRGLEPLTAHRVHVELYVRWMQEVRTYKPATIFRRLSVVIGFYRTAVIDGVLTGSPADHVRRPHVPPESPTLGLSHLQFEAMLQAARTSPNINDFALVTMLGLRIFEACGADVQDLREEHGHRVLKVRGKGGKVVLTQLGQTERMLLTVATTHQPATDLGFLLHKHPDRVQHFEQSFGTVTVFYPEATHERCTVALMLDVDPVRLARSRGKGSPDFSLAQYVNDRPYAASSLLAVAMAQVFSTARSGRCASRQDLADTPIPLEVVIPVLPCRGGPIIAHRLFEPLGWTVEAQPIPLDDAFTEWGNSRYVRLRITGTVRLADTLNQLHVLLPVLDESKHYWQGPDEVDKLMRSGEAWLPAHPERELITRRYLGRAGGLRRVAMARLAELGDDLAEVTEPAEDEEVRQPDERRLPLNAQRHEAVRQVLLDAGAQSVIDLGCGSGQFLDRLVKTGAFTRVAGADVSARSLQYAAERLRLKQMSERQAERVQLFHGALTYEDERFAGFDAAVLMEVIEHVDPSRLEALERVVWGAAQPGVVVVTTPNSEYNVLYEGLAGMRHPDHRFEWTRSQFCDWSERVAATHGYTVERRGTGDVDEKLGAPTQLAIFTRKWARDD